MEVREERRGVTRRMTNDECVGEGEEARYPCMLYCSGRMGSEHSTSARCGGGVPYCPYG